MKHINFILDVRVHSEIIGSPPEQVEMVEQQLGFKIPHALKEYLLLMGEKTIYSEYDYHGTKDLIELHEWIFEWISRYRKEGIEIKEIEQIIPFDKFQDTFFYLPVDGSENPPVYAFDIHYTPTIRKLHDKFSDFVLEKYLEKIKKKEQTATKKWWEIW